METQPTSEAMTYRRPSDANSTPKASRTDSSTLSLPKTDVTTPDTYPSSPRSLSSQLVIDKVRGRDRGERDRDRDLEREEEYDSASMLSTSSRSTTQRLKSGLTAAGISMRRRVATDSNSNSNGINSSLGLSPSSYHRSRRASGSGVSVSSRRSNNNNPGGEQDADDAAIMSLGTSTRLALQDAGTKGSGWGVGDELRMGLE